MDSPAPVRVGVDRGACVGSGQCALAAETVFDQDDEALVVLLDPTPPAERRAAVEDAAAGCPARAITLTTG